MPIYFCVLQCLDQVWFLGYNTEKSHTTMQVWNVVHALTFNL